MQSPIKARTIRFRGEIRSQVDASEQLVEPGDCIIVHRGIPRLFVFACPCGCGDIFPINLDKRADKAWRLYPADAGLTLFPSVWRDTGCESHFIVWDGAIRWMDALDVPQPQVPTPLRESVLALMVQDDWRHYVSIADELEENPWIVKSACNELKESGEIISGEDALKNSYRLTPLVRTGRI